MTAGGAGEAVEAGDRVWVRTVALHDADPEMGTLYTDYETVPLAEALPDHPALPIVARWLAGLGADAADVLTGILDAAVTEAERDAELWEGRRPERVAADRREALAARALLDDLMPLLPVVTPEEAVAAMEAYLRERYPHVMRDDAAGPVGRGETGDEA